MPRRLLLVVAMMAAAVLGGSLRVAGFGVTDRLYAMQPSPRAAFDAGLTVPDPKPTVDLHVDVAHEASPATVQDALALCQGPVTVRFAGIGPTLLAEHDFCGGTWVLRLDPGEVVRLRGSDDAGTYRVTRRIKAVPKGSSAYVLEGMGDVVAQTCLPDGSTLRLVGLSRIG